MKSVAKKVFYVVIIGRKTGVFNNWEECRMNVEKFPGSEFKKFTNNNEANKYFSKITNENNKMKKAQAGAQQDISLTLDELKNKYNKKESAVCFVDGSYSPELNKYSFGGVLVSNGESRMFSQSGEDDILTPLKNVAGELLGAQEAMKICMVNGVKELNLFYDFEGIEKWCTGIWKCRCDGAQEYQNFYNVVKRFVKVNFIKVKSHSQIEMNDVVDELAKKALGISA